MSSDKFDARTLESVFAKLDKIVTREPGLAEKVLETITAAVKQENQSSSSLIVADRAIRGVISTNLKLMDKALDAIAIATQSGGNTGESLKEFCATLVSIANNNSVSNGAFKATDILATAVQSPKISDDGLRNACDVIYAFKSNPVLEHNVMNVFDNIVKSDANTDYSLSSAYTGLFELVKCPSSEGRAFGALAKAARSDENSFFTLRKVYSELPKIAQDKPKLAGKLLDVCLEAAKSKRDNDANCLIRRNCLAELIKVDSTLLDKVLQNNKSETKKNNNETKPNQANAAKSGQSAAMAAMLANKGNFK